MTNESTTFRQWVDAGMIGAYRFTDSRGNIGVITTIGDGNLRIEFENTLGNYPTPDDALAANANRALTWETAGSIGDVEPEPEQPAEAEESAAEEDS